MGEPEIAKSILQGLGIIRTESGECSYPVSFSMSWDRAIYEVIKWLDRYKQAELTKLREQVSAQDKMLDECQGVISGLQDKIEELEKQATPTMARAYALMEVQDAHQREQRLVEALERLKNLLGKDGAYSVCRTDGQPMSTADTMELGAAFIKADEALTQSQQSAQCTNHHRMGPLTTHTQCKKCGLELSTGAEPSALEEEKDAT